jgi:hypothetical protein
VTYQGREGTVRSSTWLLAISLVIMMPFAAISLGGCGSSSGGARDGGPGGTGGNVGSGGSSGSGGAGGADAAACTPMDASAATINGGALWACFESACMTQLVACASDCACNNAVLGALQCAATGGGQTTCFAPVAAVGTNGMAVAICLLTSTSSCSPNLDAGSEGPGDGGGDAGADATDQGG